jgi:hypothetical protein
MKLVGFVREAGNTIDAQVAAHQGAETRLARSSGCFPLTLALSLGEREQRANAGRRATPARQATFAAPPTTGARFSLSPGERAGVRGNAA